MRDGEHNEAINRFYADLLFRDISFNRFQRTKDWLLLLYS